MFRHTTLLRVFAIVATVSCALAAGAAGAEEGPEQCVARYMRAWVAGDWTTVQSLWDAPSRRIISAADLRNRCTLVLTGGDKDTVRLKNALHTSRVNCSRPARFDGAVARTVAGNDAEVDCKATFSFQSRYGMPFAFLLPDAVAQTPKGSREAYYLVVAAKHADEPENVDTASRGSRDLTLLHGKPDVLLHFRRFHLVKENGEWRISNAVSLEK